MSSGHRQDAQPALIAIDWGSSNLRVALLDAQGVPMDRRESSAGIFKARDSDFTSVLWQLCGDWVTTYRIPLLACGMIGSRQGIVEVPYLTCPAGANDLARGLGRIEFRPQLASTEDSPISLFIVPGLKTGSAGNGWDVVRGEETQLLGASSTPGQLFILPGTHSKWMLRRQDGQIESFQTYMTGELFDLLRSHGSLSSMMTAPQESPDAFKQGVCDVSSGGLENRLFGVRTSGLMGRFPPDALADYLSGLLIGAELKAGFQRFEAADQRQPIAVLGSARLTSRYAKALACFDRACHELPGDAVFSGLITIARSAGLLFDQHAQRHLPQGVHS